MGSAFRQTKQKQQKRKQILHLKRQTTAQSNKKMRTHHFFLSHATPYIHVLLFLICSQKTLGIMQFTQLTDKLSFNISLFCLPFKIKMRIYNASHNITITMASASNLFSLSLVQIKKKTYVNYYDFLFERRFV